jgi:hypothetical protein
MSGQQSGGRFPLRGLRSLDVAVYGLSILVIATECDEARNDFDLSYICVSDVSSLKV